MPSYSLITFGCQMNVHDSSRMHEVLQGHGYREAEEASAADVVVFNTCSIREKAENKLRSEVGRWAADKRKGRDVTIVVAGCVAQQEGERLIKKLPELDLVIGPDNIPELPALLADVSVGGLPRARTVFDVDEPHFLQAAPETIGAVAPTAFVTTMKGCNERCSYCIVPYTRGPERYRPSSEILSEIKRLVDNGVREVTLLGQTVNSYRDPMGALPQAPEADPSDPDESEFAALLRAIAEQVPDLYRLRYTSPHPRHLTPSLIAAHRDLRVLANHVHLPVQSGSDRILKRMIRRYRRKEFVERANALKASRPGFTLSTDIIVGFPGETDEEAAATASLIEEVGFVGVFGFKYSERPYTPSRKLSDDVAEKEKGRRLAAVFDVSERLFHTHLKTLVGSQQEILVEGKSKTGTGLVSGRTQRNEIVHFPLPEGKAVIGQVVKVDILEANKHSLRGELCDESLHTLPALDQAPKPKRRALPLVP